jgi:hypothetical protein
MHQLVGLGSRHRPGGDQGNNLERLNQRSLTVTISKVTYLDVHEYAGYRGYPQNDSNFERIWVQLLQIEGLEV